MAEVNYEKLLAEAAERLKHHKSTWSKLPVEKRAEIVAKAAQSPEVSGDT